MPAGWHPKRLLNWFMLEGKAKEKEPFLIGEK